MLASPPSWSGVIRLTLDDPTLAEQIWTALRVESEPDSERVRIEWVRIGPGEIGFHVESSSTSRLRASLNAHLRWLELAQETQRLAHKRSGGPAAPGS
jgi:tRNA threonylcarbamoyladenosine modification (KEOPS) complex  Pcc1 subunit